MFSKCLEKDDKKRAATKATLFLHYSVTPISCNLRSDVASIV